MGYLGILILLIISGCEHSPEPLPAKSIAANFPPCVSEILTKKCISCHNPTNPNNRGFDYSSWEAAFTHRNPEPSIVPYQPNWSLLFLHTNVDESLGSIHKPTMPPDSSQWLSQNEVLCLRSWIAAGAPDANGKYYWQQKEASGRGKAFILNSGSDLMTVVDVETNKIMRQISVGVSPSLEAPHFNRISPDGNFVYVTLIGGAGPAVEKYRTDNYQLVGRTSLPIEPANLAVSPNGKRLLVTHWTTSGAAKLSLIDTETMRPLDILNDPLGEILDRPHGVYYTNDNVTAYVTANNGNYVARVDMRNDVFQNVKKISVEPGRSPRSGRDINPYDCILSADEKKLFVVCDASHDLRVLDLTTDSVITIIRNEGINGIGKGPRLLARAGSRLFISCSAAENFAMQGSVTGCISVVDMESLQWIKNIWGVGHQPKGLDVDIRKNILYVSLQNQGGGAEPPHHAVEGSTCNYGKFNLIDLNSLTVIPNKSTDLPCFPVSVAVSGS
jgi:YVTN family beta-propeller protein